MHRPTLGWIALGLLSLGVVIWVWFPESSTLRDSCWRMALVLGLVWLALPQLSTLPRWAYVSAGVAAAIVLWRPKLLLLVVPALAVIWLLRPRKNWR